MFFKNKKIELLKEAILSYDPSCTFNLLISKTSSDNLFIYICKKYRFKNMAYPSQVHSFIHKNINYLKNYSKMNMKIKNLIKLVLLFLPSIIISMKV